MVQETMSKKPGSHAACSEKCFKVLEPSTGSLGSWEQCLDLLKTTTSGTLGAIFGGLKSHVLEILEHILGFGGVIPKCSGSLVKKIIVESWQPLLRILDPFSGGCECLVYGF